MPRKSDLPADPRDAVRWVRDRLPDVEGGRREVAAWIQEHLPHAPDLRPRRRGPEPTALLLPAVLAAAGAGAAFWWWTQWARGREETRIAEEGAAHPEHIMDHAPPPAPTGNAPNPSDAKLKVPAEEVMAHAPPSEEPASAKAPKRKLDKVDPVVAPKAEAALQRSLAVQASPEPPKPRRRAAKPSA